jgi:beta-mannosidase
MNVIRQFADTADFNIAAPVMESHQKNDGGNARIAETMFRYFRFPVDFENFVYVSQVQQALAIKTAVTQWRGLEPHCMSTLIWQLNDTWPVCSWASLDYGGGWKVHHHLAQDFYAPVKVMPDGDDLALRAVNDRREPVSVDLTAYACAINGPARKLGRGGAVRWWATPRQSCCLSHWPICIRKRFSAMAGPPVMAVPAVIFLPRTPTNPTTFCRRI